MEGVMDKYIPGDYEFDVPAKLIELYTNKDYGQYSENGKCLYVLLLQTTQQEEIQEAQQ